MIAVAILRRRLREGTSREDLPKEEGFNAPNRMLNVADPREVIVIAMTAVESAEDGAWLIDVDQQRRGESPQDSIIEPDIDRTFAVLVAEDDFSASGSLDYQPAATAPPPTSPPCTTPFRWLARF